MEISNPQTLDHIIGANGNVLRVKIMNIGPWDMVSSASLVITHGLTFADIIMVGGYVLSDTGLTAFPLYTNAGGSASPDWDLDVDNWSAFSIILMRRAGGIFDGVNFNDAVMNRGRVIIWYTE